MSLTVERVSIELAMVEVSGVIVSSGWGGISEARTMQPAESVGDPPTRRQGIAAPDRESIS